MLIKFGLVTAATVAAAFAMYELKNWANRSEALRAMGQLAKIVSEYKQKNGSIPPESYVEGLKEKLEGRVRMGNLHYRARWISFDSSPDTIVAFVRKRYNSLFFKPGAIVLLFDGRVEWMDEASFEKLYARQKNPLEEETAITPRI
jgi:hypothetical protein